MQTTSSFPLILAKPHEALIIKKFEGPAEFQAQLRAKGFKEGELLQILDKGDNFTVVSAGSRQELPFKLARMVFVSLYERPKKSCSLCLQQGSCYGC